MEFTWNPAQCLCGFNFELDDSHSAQCRVNQNAAKMALPGIFCAIYTIWPSAALVRGGVKILSRVILGSFLLSCLCRTCSYPRDVCKMWPIAKDSSTLSHGNGCLSQK